MNLLHQRFEAHAVHPSQGTEVIAGDVILSVHGLRFESGTVVWEIPIERLIAEVREGDEERIAFSDPAQPGLEVFTVDLALLDCRASPPLVRARQELAARLSRREIRRRLKMVAYTLVACAVIIWLGGVMTSAMVRSIANRVPPQWDAKFGASVVEQLGKKEKFLDDSNAVARLTKLAAPLLRVLPPSPNGYQFHIVEDDEPNACALPGGHIIVNTGLLKLADRPEEVLGVIAHEVAHVTERHLYREQITTAGPLMVCRLFLSRGGAGSLMAGGAALVVGEGFSQEYETEADDVGWKYLVAANIDPRGLAEMFRKIKQDPSVKKGEFVPHALRSHPALDKRIRRLDAKWAKLPRKVGFITLNSQPILSP